MANNESMTGRMSAGTRRRFIDFIVNRNLALNNTVWWSEESPSPETAAYREWALTAAPILRAELETTSDDELRAKHDCREREWFDFFQARFEHKERQQESERQQQYHQSVARKGGRTHRSAGQPLVIIEACKDMCARIPRMTAKKAYQKLRDTGHEMPDGRVIRFEGKLALETFRTKYWPKRKVLQ
jgi:hypothetical protein